MGGVWTQLENKDSHLLKLQYNGYNERDARQFLGRSHTHATTATAGLARISIEKNLRYLLPTHTSCWNAPWKTFSPIWIGFCFRVCLVLPHSSGVSVTSSSPVPVLWYRYDYDCHYHLSYDVTRRSGLRDPLTTQPSARASTETLLWLPCKNYYNYLLPLKCCIRYSSTAVPILGKVLVTLF